MGERFYCPGCCSDVFPQRRRLQPALEVRQVRGQALQGVHVAALHRLRRRVPEDDEGIAGAGDAIDAVAEDDAHPAAPHLHPPLQVVPAAQAAEVSVVHLPQLQGERRPAPVRGPLFGAQRGLHRQPRGYRGVPREGDKGGVRGGLSLLETVGKEEER